MTKENLLPENFESIYKNIPAHEREKYTETERKFALMDTWNVAKYADMREKALPIRQIYLSHPDEQYSLRLREKTGADGAVTYVATLKDTGRLTANGLQRLEIETEISAETFHYYDRQAIYPDICKLRYSPVPGVDYDFFDDDYVVVEVEDPALAAAVLADHESAIEITSHPLGSNEFLAHENFRKVSGDWEPLRPQPDIDPSDMERDILERLANQGSVIVRVNGRSGSGKSTLVRDQRTRLEARGVPSIVLSTDDYNRGKTYLDAITGEVWTDFESPAVYDTESMAHDIDRLLRGETVLSRRFDFGIQEQTINGEHTPAPVIFIEGIHAGSPDFDRFESLNYDIPTSVAESIGRIIKRDFDGSREQAAFPTRESRLRYALEVTEPAYQSRQRN